MNYQYFSVARIQPECVYAMNISSIKIKKNVYLFLFYLANNIKYNNVYLIPSGALKGIHRKPNSLFLSCCMYPRKYCYG